MGDGWWLRELVWVWKILYRYQVVQYLRCSCDCRAVTAGNLKGPEDKGKNWSIVQIQDLLIRIFTQDRNGAFLWHSQSFCTVQVPSRLGVFANFRTHLLSFIATVSAGVKYQNLKKRYSLMKCRSCMKLHSLYLVGDWEAVTRRKESVCFSVMFCPISFISITAAFQLCASCCHQCASAVCWASPATDGSSA